MPSGTVHLCSFDVIGGNGLTGWQEPAQLCGLRQALWLPCTDGDALAVGATGRVGCMLWFAGSCYKGMWIGGCGSVIHLRCTDYFVWVICVQGSAC